MASWTPTPEQKQKLRINASKGGKATGALGEEFVQERATKGGLATLKKYGRDYYFSLKKKAGE